MKRARCTECGAVMRRLYYQTGSGRRVFKGCGWGCFECSPENAIARRGYAIASAEPPPEPVPEPEPEPEPAPGLLRSIAAGIQKAAARSAERAAEESRDHQLLARDALDKSTDKRRARDSEAPPDLLASLDAAADEISSETRYRKAKK